MTDGAKGNVTERLEGRLEDCRRRGRRMRSLVQTATLLTSSLDQEEILRSTLLAAGRVMNAEAASVLLLDGETGELVVHRLEVSDTSRCDEPQEAGLAGFRVPAGQGIAGDVVRTGRAANIPDAYEDPRFYAEVDKKTGIRTRAVLAVPLKAQGRILGVAMVVNRLDGGAFNREDVTLFRHFCDLVAVAIENSRLHRESLAKEAIDRELAAAREIQAAFLPMHLPDVTGYRFAEIYRSARAVGGDFYDLVTCPGGLLGIVVGDVSGKGVSAALLGAAVSAEVRRLLETSCSASKIVTESNRVVGERSVRGMFVTMATVMLDLESGAGTLASAGHLPLLHYQAGTGSARFIDGEKGPPAGVVPEMEYENADVRLAVGDRLLFYTDGLVEALDPGSEERGLDLLKEIVEENGASSSTLENVILDRCANGRGVAPVREDDLTYVEVYRRSASS